MWPDRQVSAAVALPSAAPRWRYSPLWVKLLALILVPLMAAGALCAVVARDRLARTQDAWRISQLAQLAESCYIVSDDLYYDGYILSAQAELGAFLALAPTVQRSLARDQAGARDAALVALLPRMDRLLADQARAHHQSEMLSHQLVVLAYDIWVVAEQAMGTMSTLAVGLAGSSNLGTQIQAVQQVAGVNGDIQAALATIFAASSVPLGLPRARAEGELQAQLQLASSDLAGAVANPSSALGQWRRSDLGPDRRLLVAADVAATVPPTRPVPLSTMIGLAPLAMAFGAATLSGNADQLATVARTASAIRQSAVTYMQLTLLAMALLVLLTVALTLVMYRNVRRPMNALAVRARRISDGSLELGDETGTREIVEVAGALNEAIRNLDQIKTQAEALGRGDLTNPVLNQPLPGRLGESLFASVLQATALQRQLGYRATHDPLTGLLNREAANDDLGSVLAASRAEGATVVAMFIDLDGFKQMNDNYGHAFGDQVLRLTADRVCAQVTGHDLVYRLGGDEFLVVTQGAPGPGEPEGLGQRILQAVGQPIEVEPGEARLGASIGIAVAAPGDGYTASQLLKDADTAVYKAKTSGRNQVVVFDAGISHERRANRDLGASLRHAFEQGQLELRFQPLVGALGGEIWGFAAELCWPRPGQTLSPKQLVALAAQTDLIIELDRWALDQAGAALASWGAGQNLEACRVAVPLSGRHLGRNLLADDVARVIKAHQLAPARLLVEISAGALDDDIETAQAELKALRALGVRIGLSEVGAGPICIGPLTQVPADLVKIDPEFLAPLPGAPSREVIVGLVIGAAHAMKMNVAAAGVDRRDQLEMLQGLGCEIAQGLCVAPAMPAAALADWARQWQSAEHVLA
jgi:diguanylate cyclase (GGDEF)-like protein